MTSREIAALLAPWNAPKGIIVDSDYALPDKRWVLGEFSRVFAQTEQNFRLTKWSKNSNDCDKFAERARVVMNACNVMAPDSALGMAFGMLGYLRDTGSAHCINFGVTAENNQPVVFFYEPQSRGEIFLTPTELLRIAWFFI